jgi:hypothetical protein
VTVTPNVSADGRVENFLADDANGDIRYRVIATRNGLPRNIQLAPDAVTEARPILDQAERHPRSCEIEPSLGPADHGRPGEHSSRASNSR